jgi:ApaG protein
MAEPAYQAVTRGLTVRVQPEFLPEQSEPSERRWFWAYHIAIENNGRETVQLIARRWIITDAFGRVEEVKGLGVIGEQPVLKPGERYSYTSGCPLPTSSGSMVGTYVMTTESGERFHADIPAFSLDVPGGPRVVN